MKHQNQNADVYTAGILLFLLLLFGFQIPRINNQNDLYFPVFVLASLAVLFLLLLIKLFTKPDIRPILTEKKPLYVLCGGLVAVVWIVLLDKLGFFSTAFLAVNVLSLIIDPNFGKGQTVRHNIRSVTCTLAVNAVILAAIYLIFRLWLDVPTPQGLFL